MKRIIILCLLVSVLLTGCGISQGKDSEATGESAATPTTPQLSPLYTPNANGITVKTDYSNYTADTTVAAKFTRLSEEPLTTLQPSEDYGRIFPFVGERKLYYYDWCGLYNTTFCYGLVTETGCIVTDPVYSDVELLWDITASCYLPYWVLESTDEDGNLIASDLAAVDGSFVLKGYTDFTASDGHILCTKEHEDKQLEFVLLDESREAVLSSEELPFADRIRGWSHSVAYYSGYFVIPFGTGVMKTVEDWDEGEYTYEITEYYIMNLQGELCAGPYSYTWYDERGYLEVCEDEDYYFLNLNGTEPVAEPRDIRFLDDGYAYMNDETTTEFLTPDGDVILSISQDEYFDFSPAGEFLVIDCYSRSRIYNMEGALVQTVSAAVRPLDINSLIFVESEREIYIEDLNSGKRYDLPRSNFGYEHSDEDCGLIFVKYNNNGRYTTMIIDRNLELLCETDRDVHSIEICNVGSDRKEYTLVYTEDGAKLFSPEEMEHFPKIAYDDCIVYDGWFRIDSENYCRIYNADMELIFSYPLLSGMGD